MRWDDLFADLEGQFDALQAADLTGEVADRTRREVARQRLVDRLRPSVGSQLWIQPLGSDPLAGRLQRVGADWALLALSGQPDALVSLAAIQSLRGLPTISSEPGGEGPVL